MEKNTAVTHCVTSTTDATIMMATLQ